MPSFSRALGAFASAPEGLAARGPAFPLGAAAAAVSWAAVVAAALLAWVAAPESSAPWTAAWGVGSAAWFLGHGSPVRAGSVDLSVTPLLLFFFIAGSAIWGLRRAVRDLDDGSGSGRGELVAGVRREVVDVGLAAIGGYAAVAVLALLTTLAGPVRPHPVLGLVAPSVWHSVASSSPWRWTTRTAGSARSRRWTTAGASRRTGSLVGPRLVWATLTRLATVLVVVVLVVIGVGGSRIDEVSAALDPGPVGTLVLAVAQVLVLPNLATWALAWMTGPGFSVGAGTSVTLTFANPGLQPLLPVLGALPAGGAMPGWAVGAVLLPVLVGLLLGRAAERELSWLPALAASVAAAVIVAATAAGLTALGAGSLGVDRFCLGRAGRQTGRPLALPRARSRCVALAPRLRRGGLGPGAPLERYVRRHLRLGQAPDGRRLGSVRDGAPRRPRPGRAWSSSSPAPAPCSKPSSTPAPSRHGAQVVAVGPTGRERWGAAHSGPGCRPSSAGSPTTPTARPGTPPSRPRSPATSPPWSSRPASSSSSGRPSWPGSGVATSTATTPCCPPSPASTVRGTPLRMASGRRRHGVHRRRGVDTGAIVGQCVVPVLDDDTEETLTERIKAAERPQLVDLVGRMAREGFTVTGRKVTIP